MKNFYYFKWPAILVCTGFIIRIIGAMMKILHWPNADESLMAGKVVIVIALFWFIIKFILLKKQGSNN